MAVVRDSAVILARVDYSETSQIITALSRSHGKIRAIAKGIKRGTKTRFAAGIDLFDVGELVVSSREERPVGLTTLTEWKQSRGFLGLRDRLFRLYGAQYAAEITNGLTEDWDPHEGLFNELLDTLAGLSQADEPFATVARFQTAILDSVGSMPRFDVCVLCGRTDELTYFSSFEGGTICRHCEPAQVEKRAISPRTLDTVLRLQEPLSMPDPNPERERGVDAESERAAKTVQPNPVGAFDILDYHISHLMGRAPVMAAKLIPPDRRRAAQQ